MNIELYYDGNTIENATWADVEAVLPKLRGDVCVSLAIIPWPEKGPYELVVRSEDGNYLPQMLVAGEPHIRVFVNQEARGKEDVYVGGYDYTAMAVTQDFDLVVRMIKEFYETGDVSKDLLK